MKYLTLLCADDEDQEIVKAAAGALAMLTSQSKKICAKIFEVIFVENKDKPKYVGFIFLTILYCQCRESDFLFKQVVYL